MKKQILYAAPLYLRDLLGTIASAGLVVSQHQTDARPNEWYVSMPHDGLDAGDLGPFATAELALLAGIAWLVEQAAQQ